MKHKILTIFPILVLLFISPARAQQTAKEPETYGLRFECSLSGGITDASDVGTQLKLGVLAGGAYGGLKVMYHWKSTNFHAPFTPADGATLGIETIYVGAELGYEFKFAKWLYIRPYFSAGDMGIARIYVKSASANVTIENPTASITTKRSVGGGLFNGITLTKTIALAVDIQLMHPHSVAGYCGVSFRF